MISSFFTALQFLTRIRIVKQTEWDAAAFGKSVTYFPLVGAVVGGLLAAFSYIFYGVLPQHIYAACLVIAEIVITGGLHCDGFMDTMDGVFSGRSQERMLEIMKDSRVGANGVVGFACLLLSKWSLYMDMPFDKLVIAVFVMPVIGRCGMTLAITRFPYARPDGMGKAFAQYAGKRALIVAYLVTAAIVLPFGRDAIVGLVSGTVFTLLMANYISKRLGGLTGDVYGAVTETTQIVVLFAFLLSKGW